MSEFKYACPVCGQHIKCDSSQAGTVMQCPTCFQKITVPQAPTTDDPKFILTGTKVGGERPLPKVSEATPIASAPEKGVPVGALVLVVLLCAAGAAAYMFRGDILKSVGFGRNAETNQVANATEDDQTPPPAKTNQPPPKPAMVAPPANDTNWILNLVGVVIPDSTAAGRIHGQDFIVERAVLQNGTLILRAGRSGPLNFAAQINFGGAQPEALAGHSLNITTNALLAARVEMVWPDGSQIAREDLTSGYAMRLDFGLVTGNRLPGKIYLCVSDEKKSYLAGTFNAEIRRSKPKRQ